MKEQLRIATAILALTIAACGTNATPSPTPAAITVSDAWARAAVSSASDGNSAVYMTIRSRAAADRLVKAASDAAGVAELHTVAMVNGVMKMRPVEAIDVPAGGTVTLAPGGFHVMLIGLKKDLKVGEAVTLTLTFEKYGTLTLTVPVRAG